MKKVTETMRRTRVRLLFDARLDKEHTENGVLKFYEWLLRRYPGLVPKPIQGDAYQQLKSDLAGLWKG
jgi:hypothetical protein